MSTVEGLAVAHIGPSALPVRSTLGGAVERRMVELARAQAGGGARVTVFSTGEADGWEAVDGVTYQTVRSRLPRPYRDYEFLLRLRQRVAATGADVVHAHNAPDAARWLPRGRAPVVLSLDNFRFRFTNRSAGRRYWKSSLQRFDLLLPVSHACLDQFLAFFGGRWRTAVLHNGVNVEQFRSDPGLRRRGRERLALGGSPAVVYVGRLCHQKGTDTLLDAWPGVASRVRGARLMLAGPTGQFGRWDPADPLVSRARGLGADVLGPVPEPELNEVYNAADVFVMPTRFDEMFGMAAVEAQSCGAPVVASNLGPLREAVGDDSGVWVEPGDAAGLAQAISGLLTDENERRRLAEAGRRHAARFSWARICGDSARCYETALGRVGSGRG